MVKCEGWKEERYTAMCMVMGGGGGLFFPPKQLEEGRWGEGHVDPLKEGELS